MHLVDQERSAAGFTAPVLVGESQALQRVRLLAERVAGGEAKVLITGESGVGKDVIARYVHAKSKRAHQRYVALNCASFSETLLESELFGHVKGSFTGAYRDKIGKLQQAHRGTIFLDEIAEMSLRMQAMLLRFLENGEILPVGADTMPIRVDVRVISATNRDLQDMVAKGEFREDLLFRIRVAHIHVPALRERKEDVRALINYTLTRGGHTIQINDEAMDMLERYRWPGNVRELQNVVEQTVAMTLGDEAGVAELPPSILARQAGAISPVLDRRRRMSDDLYDGLISGGYQFWTHVHPMFMNRDITRADLRQLVRRGLAATGGNYRGVLQLFGMEDGDYKRFLNFLGTHDCAIDFREFRGAKRQLAEAASARSRS
ncbi:MAG: sigma-54 dependent transcriptional regulator [Vicinamibacterales bacterium]